MNAGYRGKRERTQRVGVAAVEVPCGRRCGREVEDKATAGYSSHRLEQPVAAPADARPCLLPPPSPSTMLSIPSPVPLPRATPHGAAHKSLGYSLGSAVSTVGLASSPTLSERMRPPGMWKFQREKDVPL